MIAFALLTVSDHLFISALPRNCVNCSRCNYRNLLLLPGSEELKDHGIFQEHGPTGESWTIDAINYATGSRRFLV